MKVLYLFVTTEAEEVDAVQNFIDAYESEGGTWEGEITVVENISNNDITEEFIQSYIDDGIELVLRNTAPSFSGRITYEYAKERGTLFVVPVGSNTHVEIDNFENRYSLITCGSGIGDYGNATAYPCFFYDAAESEADGMEIVDIRQTGTSYNVTHIQRQSSSYLYFKLDGLTTLEMLNNIGLLMYENSSGSNHSDVPVYFSSMAGSDISPLPDGVKYVSYVGDGFFQIAHETNAGTIGGAFQSLSGGAMKFGYTDNTRVMIQLRDYSLATASMGVTLKDISGFGNNPNGLRTITSYISNLGFGDKVTITYNLGGGSASSKGNLIFATQSYSTPVIAGKLAFIKDSNNCSWDEAIGRAVNTASEEGVFDSVNGYGIIDIAEANAREDLSLGRPELELTEISPGIVGLTWTMINFAEHYEIWFRGELFDTVTAQITTWGDELSRQSHARKNAFQVRAKRGDTYSEFSNTEEYSWYYHPIILYKNVI